MKRILFLLLFMGALPVVQAQRYYNESSFLLGVNAEYKYPVGDFAKDMKSGIGVNVSGKYLINRVLGIGFEAGYHPFKSKIGSNRSVAQELTCNVVPILWEATFYIPTWDRTLLPYFGLHFGGYLTNVSVTKDDDYGESVSKKVNRFSIGGGPNVGLLYEMSEYLKLDLRLRGDYISTFRKDYVLNEELQSEGVLPFDKILTFGATVGFLYTF